MFGLQGLDGNCKAASGLQIRSINLSICKYTNAHAHVSLYLFQILEVSIGSSGILPSQQWKLSSVGKCKTYDPHQKVSSYCNYIRVYVGFAGLGV